MKCFMHPDIEAIATCKNCGKAMCADCSAYSNHSGICPQCKLEEYQNELPKIVADLKSTIWRWVGKGFLGIIGWVVSIIISFADYAAIGLIATVVATIWSVVKIPYFRKKLARKQYVEGEIEKISKSLTKGSAII